MGFTGDTLSLMALQTSTVSKESMQTVNGINTDTQYVIKAEEGVFEETTRPTANTSQDDQRFSNKTKMALVSAMHVLEEKIQEAAMSYTISLTQDMDTEIVKQKYSQVKEYSEQLQMLSIQFTTLFPTVSNQSMKDLAKELPGNTTTVNSTPVIQSQSERTGSENEPSTISDPASSIVTSQNGSNDPTKNNENSTDPVTGDIQEPALQDNIIKTMPTLHNTAANSPLTLQSNPNSFMTALQNNINSPKPSTSPNFSSSLLGSNSSNSFLSISMNNPKKSMSTSPNNFDSPKFGSHNPTNSSIPASFNGFSASQTSSRKSILTPQKTISSFKYTIPSSSSLNPTMATSILASNNVNRLLATSATDTNNPVSSPQEKSQSLGQLPSLSQARWSKSSHISNIFMNIHKGKDDPKPITQYNSTAITPVSNNSTIGPTISLSNPNKLSSTSQNNLNEPRHGSRTSSMNCKSISARDPRLAGSSKSGPTTQNIPSNVFMKTSSPSMDNLRSTTQTPPTTTTLVSTDPSSFLAISPTNPNRRMPASQNSMNNTNPVSQNSSGNSIPALPRFSDRPENSPANLETTPNNAIPPQPQATTRPYLKVPIFQLTPSNHAPLPNEICYDNAQHFIKTFENIVSASGYDIDSVWKKAIPVAFSGELRDWAKRVLITMPSWKDAADMINRKFARTETAQLRANALSMVMKENDRYEDYTIRYIQAMKDAKFNIRSPAVEEHFLKTLNQATKQTLSERERRFYADVVDSIDTDPFLDDVQTSESSKPVRHVGDHKKINRHHPYKKGKKRYYCKQHGVNKTHDDADCFSNKHRANSLQSSSSNAPGVGDIGGLSRYFNRDNRNDEKFF